MTLEETVRRFHKLYYSSGVHVKTRWLGVRALKCPLDLWIYQEILVRNRPDLIVETGTEHGGSALYLASVCDLIDNGRIVTIDLKHREGRPDNPRITYMHGNSIKQEVVASVRNMIQPGESVMVILDSAHERDHVLEELRSYGPLVTPGQYLIVEDTNINGHPAYARFGPGPMEALEAFLGEEPLGSRFAVDHSCEKFLMTFNPSGYLVRLEDPGPSGGPDR